MSQVPQMCSIFQPLQDEIRLANLAGFFSFSFPFLCVLKDFPAKVRRECDKAKQMWNHLGCPELGLSCRPNGFVCVCGGGGGECRAINYAPVFRQPLILLIESAQRKSLKKKVFFGCFFSLSSTIFGQQFFL